MPNSGPPWVTTVLVAVTVENIPVIPAAATEYPIASFGTLNTASSDYQTVRKWTVTAGRIGILQSVEMACNNYEVAQFELIVKGVTVFVNKTMPESFTKEWPELHLAAGESVELLTKSNGSDLINVWCDFNGKEVA